MVVADIPRADIDHPVRADRRRNRDVGHPAREVPQQAAGGIVRTHLALTGGHDLGPQLISPDEGGRPVVPLITIDSPVLLARSGIERRDVGTRVIVEDQDQLVAEQGRRGAGSPAPLIELRLEAVRPQQRSLQVIREEAQVPEKDVYTLAVGDRRFRRVGVFRVAREPDGPLVSDALPSNRSGLKIQAVDLPLMCARSWIGHAFGAGWRQVQTLPRFLTVLIGNHAGDEDLIPPHDRAGPPSPGMVVFQATFSVALQRSGNAGSSSTTPVIAAPRHWVQWSAAAEARPPIEVVRAVASRRTATRDRDPRTGRILYP